MLLMMRKRLTLRLPSVLWLLLLLLLLRRLPVLLWEVPLGQLPPQPLLLLRRPWLLRVLLSLRLLLLPRWRLGLSSLL